MGYKKFFEGKSLVINSNIISLIRNSNLSLNEFFLLLYFLNADNKNFLIDDIKKVLGFSKSDVLSSLNFLIEKGFVELKTKTNSSGTIIEYISLDKFYAKLEENTTADGDDIDKIKTLIESKFTFNVGTNEIEIIKAWISRGFTYGRVKEIINKINAYDVPDIRSVDKYLYELSSDNKNSTDINIFDYNWLEDEKK